MLRGSLADGVGAILIVLLGGCSGSEEDASPSKPTLEGGLVDSGHDAGTGAEAASDAGTDAPAEAAPIPFDGPESLSQTGLYADIISRTLAPGVMAYDVRFPLWSDGSDKQRYLLLPEGQTIDTTDLDWWTFPVGTKAWKEFVVQGQAVETRYLEKRADGWLMVAYLWNDQGTEAFPIPAGLVDASGTQHDVPSQADCEQCHNGVGDVLVGVSAIQLSGDGQPGFSSTLAQGGWLSSPPATEPVVPGDASIQAALGYLHGNCGHCHNNVHFLAQKRALRLRLSVTDTTPESTSIYQTTINAKMNHIIQGTTLAVVPGKPTESQLWVRMSYRDVDSMPPLGTEVVDSTGLAVIQAWIESLP